MPATGPPERSRPPPGTPLGTQALQEKPDPFPNLSLRIPNPQDQSNRRRTPLSACSFPPGVRPAAAGTRTSVRLRKTPQGRTSFFPPPYPLRASSIHSPQTLKQKNPLSLRTTVSLRKLVGVKGFEPLTFWSRTKRATSLRYTPGVLNGRGWKSTKLHLPCQPASAPGLSRKNGYPVLNNTGGRKRRKGSGGAKRCRRGGIQRSEAGIFSGVPREARFSGIRVPSGPGETARRIGRRLKAGGPPLRYGGKARSSTRRWSGTNIPGTRAADRRLGRPDTAPSECPKESGPNPACAKPRLQSGARRQ